MAFSYLWPNKQRNELMTNEKKEITTTKSGNNPETPDCKANTPITKEKIDTNVYIFNLLT
ncbi:hypothetical protein VCHA53P481_10267 [Vibrio chagasii]|nr:hypothetical protein VCHA32O87_10228 [Vibrio chagasii]CAH7078328.1 hypothetical protein VCHA43P284_10227 [Vibrio chagasii]CAH7105091.1 hypothetical protein VCHA53P481_10267 [Vibrio chagasii]